MLLLAGAVYRSIVWGSSCAVLTKHDYRSQRIRYFFAKIGYVVYDKLFIVV